MTEVIIISTLFTFLLLVLLFYISHLNARIKGLVEQEESTRQAFSAQIEKERQSIIDKAKQDAASIVNHELTKSKIQVETMIQTAEQAKLALDAEYVSYQEEVKRKINLLEEQYNIRSQELSNSSQLQQQKLEQLRAQEEALVEQLRIEQAAIIEQRRLQDMENDARKFYTINIDEEAVNDIKELWNVVSRFGRIALPLRKAIWEVYYRTPANEMVKRVTKGAKICGIYKITNNIDGRCYIGQSVDIGARWITHIKRALGVEDTTSNKLYPTMRSVGLHNFSFTIVEEVEQPKLREREVYWQKFFAAVDDGYSVK